MCTAPRAMQIKKDFPKKMFGAEFQETPLGYYYTLSQIAQTKKYSFKGNIFQITKHVKWLNAKKGYLGAYYKEKTLPQKCMAVLRIILTFGWLRTKKPIKKLQARYV